MEFIEADPLPEVCQNCPDRLCDECDHMMERFPLSPADARRLGRKAKERQLARLQRELDT